MKFRKKRTDTICLTTKLKINPTKEQEEILWWMSEKCRLLYNYFLAQRKEEWEKNKLLPKEKREYMEIFDQQGQLPKIKQEKTEYKKVPSMVLQNIAHIVCRDYNSFYGLYKKDETANPPKFKGKKYFTTMSFFDSIRYYDNKILLTTKKYDDNKLEFELPKQKKTGKPFKFGRIKQVSVSLEDKEFYLSIVQEQPKKPYVDNGRYQAFDLGVTKHTGVNIEGKFIELYNKRPDKYWDPKISQLESRRDKCKKYSRRWKRYNKIVLKMEKKKKNQLIDSQHKKSKKTANNTKSNTLIFGDLEVKKLSEHTNKYEAGLHKGMQNTGNISRYVNFVTYKAELVGKKVLKINERGTTQKCCCCGKVHPEMKKLSNRVMRCDCGNEIDRDKNSAVNIMLRYLSQNGLWTAYEQFVRNLRQTGVPIGIYSQETALF